MTLVRHYIDKSGRKKSYHYDTIKKEDALEHRKQYDARYRAQRRKAKPHRAARAAKLKQQHGGRRGSTAEQQPRKTLVDNLTKEQRRLIRDLHNFGLSMTKTAAVVGTTRHVVRCALERDGLIAPLEAGGT